MLVIILYSMRRACCLTGVGSAGGVPIASVPLMATGEEDNQAVAVVAEARLQDPQVQFNFQTVAVVLPMILI